jgi:hypothetical protein
MLTVHGARNRTLKRRNRYPHKWMPRVERHIPYDIFLWKCQHCRIEDKSYDEHYTPPEFGCVATFHVWKKQKLELRVATGRLRPRLITESDKLFQVESSGLVYYECVHCKYCFWPTLMDQTPPLHGCFYKIGNLPIPSSNRAYTFPSEIGSLPIPINRRSF